LQSYGWGGSRSRPEGFADGDNPSAATVERRRKADIGFLAWVREATPADLEASLPAMRGWKRVAVERRLKAMAARPPA